MYEYSIDRVAYAKSALQGLLANPENARRFDHKHMAKEAFKYADAMIEAEQVTPLEGSDVPPTPAIFVV